MIAIDLPQYWEVWLWFFIAVFFGVLLLISVAQEIIEDRRRWRKIPKHIGSVYDASSRPYRENVDLRQRVSRRA